MSEMLKTLVLPENDDRVMEAARIIESEKIANILDLSSLSDDQLVQCRSALRSTKKYKSASEKEASNLLEDNLYLGGLCLRSGLADGMIAGATHSTSDVLRVALRIIGVKPEVNVASSCFLMELVDGRKLIFADCAVNPNPNADALSEIALESAATARSLGLKPRVAMLSASTHGSAKYDDATKVQEATRLIRGLDPSLVVEGEVQADVALVPSIAVQKGVDVFDEEPANVFIFPNLDSGNIGYKLVERMAGAKAIGPILQGFNKPINDLSRGCSVEDIVELARITVQQ